MDAALHALIADIYAGVLDFSFDRFKERALVLVQGLIPFTAGVWGTGVRSTNTILTVATVNLPAERLIDYATRWQDRDFVRAAAVANPGIPFRNEDVMPSEAYRRTAIYREYSAPAGIEHALGTVYADPAADLGELVFLFRSDPAAFFTDAERALMQQLMPHLARAWQHRQIVHGLEAAHDPMAQMQEARGHAVVDDGGLVHAANPQFTASLRTRIASWSGPTLPEPLLAFLQRGEALGDFAGLRVRLSRGEHRHLLTLSESRSSDPLTRAEARVAELYACGQSSAEIARMLNVSNSTVRNQLASIYRKLDIHSKAELARRIPVRP